MTRRVLHQKHRLQTGLVCLLLLKRAQMDKKRTHRYWIHNLIRARQEKGAYDNLVRELELDKDKFFEHFRMSPEKMEYVLSLVGPALQKNATVRQPLPVKMKVVICIR